VLLHGKNVSIITALNKKALKDTQTLRGGCSMAGRGAKNFRPVADPFPGRGTAKI